MRRIMLLLTVIAATSTMALGQSSVKSAPFIHNGNASVAAQCLRTDLSLKEGDTDAAMGGVRLTTYILTNKSSSPCALSGYPRFELLRKNGRVARRAVDTETLPGDSAGGPPQLVTIEPGKTAWFNIYFNNGGAGHMGKPCPSYSKARVTAPGATQAFVLRSDIQTCPGTDFQVSPVRSGKPQ